MTQRTENNDWFTSSETDPPAPVPELPAWKAFVVQFSRETAPSSATFAGRIEHLSSGRRARFDSPQSLLKMLEKLLDEVHTNSDAIP